MARVTSDISYVASRAGEAPKWEDKIEKGLFRGRDSNQARLTLAEMSQTSELLDAGITNYNFRKINVEKWGPKADYVALHDMAKWKYNLLIDGTVAAYRAPYLFQLGTLIFKQQSEYYEWWYGDIEDGEHYVEIAKDGSDVIDKIKWAIENDNEAKTIAERGARKTEAMLTPENMYCYYAKAFEAYRLVR